jgi:hypothetical protein
MTTTLTARRLAEILWGEFPTSWGPYPGSNMSQRPVPADALITIHTDSQPHPYRMTDKADGWMAERFSTFTPNARLGRRDWMKVQAAITA